MHEAQHECQCRMRTDGDIGRPNRKTHGETRFKSALNDKPALTIAVRDSSTLGKAMEGPLRHLDVTLLDEQLYRITGLRGCRKARKNLDGTFELTDPYVFGRPHTTTRAQTKRHKERRR